MEHFKIKMDIKYYLLPNYLVLKLYNQKQNCINR